MDWPLKIQGRLVTEAEVDEARDLLRDHSFWNRSRLSRELCTRWNWRRPDGQMKDIACRELLRKLELRALIQLPPRECPGPGRLPIGAAAWKAEDRDRWIGWPADVRERNLGLICNNTRYPNKNKIQTFQHKTS